jgi:Kef-type K+ transport system membrane component KefB/mannitol/fructose-specific phosphotransferase system IIA component (Ntr-type)
MLSGFFLLAVDRVSLDHPVAIFAAVMLILLLAPIAFERLRVPGMVGLITAGVLLGPHGIHLFADNTTFKLLGTVGLLYLMFLAGIEINAEDFRVNRRSSLVFGSLTFITPFLVGAVAARIVMPSFTWPQAILLASMFASHTLLPHPIASRLGLARHRAVVTAVGGTLLTDTAALLVLAVIAQMTVSQLTHAFLLRQILLLLVYVVAVLRGLPRLGTWFFRRAGPDGPAEYTFVIACVFLASVGALIVGVEAIIGAFLAGVAFSSLVPERGVLRNRLEFVGHALFIPFFLLEVGMLVNPGLLARDWAAWRVALFMCVTVTATKWLAAWATAKGLRFSTAEGGLLFGLSVNQAAATLAAVLVGREIGLFDDSILNGTVLMILVTCIIGPWVTERRGRQVAESQRQAPPVWAPRTGRVLAAVGSPTGADPVLNLALLLAPDEEGAICALHVIQEGPEEKAAIAAADQILGRAIVRGAAAGARVEGLSRLEPSAAHGIVHAARERCASTIIMGWSDRSALSVLLFRSLLEQVLAGAPEQIVLVGRWIHPQGTSRRLRALFPPLVEQQVGFDEAIQTLRTIARGTGTSLSIICSPTVQPRLQNLFAETSAESTSAIGWSPWSDMAAGLIPPPRGDDLLVIVSARRSQAAWGSALERLPSLLARRYPHNNLLLLFPATSSEPATATVAPAAPGIPSPGGLEVRCARSALLGWTGDLAPALHLLLNRTQVAPHSAARIVHALLSNGIIELAPGIVLLHTHTAESDEALLLMATGAITTPDAAIGVARMLIVWVSPYSDPPEQHLAVLANVARMIQRSDLVDKLLQADDGATLEQNLAAAFSAPAVTSAGPSPQPMGSDLHERGDTYPLEPG